MQTYLSILMAFPGLYIRAGSRRTSLASLPDFAGYLNCFTSQDMLKRWNHNCLLFTKLQLLKNLKKTLFLLPLSLVVQVVYLDSKLPLKVGFCRLHVLVFSDLNLAPSRTFRLLQCVFSLN